MERRAFVLSWVCLVGVACSSPKPSDATPGTVAMAVTGECTSSCPLGVTLQGTLTLGWGQMNTSDARATPTVSGADGVSIVSPGDVGPVILTRGDVASMYFTYRCDAMGTGKVHAQATADAPNTVTPPSTDLAIQCGGSGLDPKTAKLRGLSELQVSHAPGRAANGTGQLQTFKADVSRVSLDALRDLALAHKLDSAPSCGTAPAPGPVVTGIIYSPNPSWPGADGGAALTWFFNGFDIGIPVPPSSVAAGRTFDAVLPAVGTDAEAVNAPGLVAIPEAVGGLVAGEVVTDGSEIDPVYRLGNFAPNATTLPSFTWAAPATPPTAIVVEIVDPRYDAQGGGFNPLVTLCSLAGTATGYAMDQPTFTAIDPTAPGHTSDRVTMYLHFVNVAATPMGDGMFLSTSESIEQNIIFRKL